jgi:hypothetical protein
MTESIKICYTVGELSIIMVACFIVGMIAGTLIWAK